MNINQDMAPVLMARNVSVQYHLESESKGKGKDGKSMDGKGEGVSPASDADSLNGSVQALSHVNLDILPGSSLSIMGPSGSGKSTLLHVLAGILPPTQGTVLYKGRDLAKESDSYRTKLRRLDFGFVFQSGQLIEEMSAQENVALPLMLDGISYGKAMKTALNWLDLLGLQTLAKHRPGEMSGGQRQRVSIARALVIKPSIVFADEPTGALDQATGESIISLLTSWCSRTGASLIMVTHDPHVAHACQTTIHMQDGRILNL